jgi:hypothetical protein
LTSDWSAQQVNGAVSLRMLNGNRKRVEKAPTPPMNASGEAFN